MGRPLYDKIKRTHMQEIKSQGPSSEAQLKRKQLRCIGQTFLIKFEGANLSVAWLDNN